MFRPALLLLLSLLATPVLALPEPMSEQELTDKSDLVATVRVLSVSCTVVTKDDKTGETLPLQFVEIHQPVRHLKKEGEYFACTDFRKPGSQDEYYDIDFWVNQKTGKLVVDNVKVHKVPVQEDGVWTQVPRYTFDGMDIEETN